MDDTKQLIIEEIRKVVPVMKQAGSNEYRIHCPFCGNRDNPRDLHLYIKCSYDPVDPLVYICFKCNSSGLVNSWFLHELGLPDDICQLATNTKINKISQMISKDNPVEILTGKPIPSALQIQYIENRLGKGFTMEDYDRFKIIWNMQAIRDVVDSPRILHTLPSNRESISFLSDNKAMMLTRTFIQNSPDSQWRKIKLVNNPNRAFYTIKSTIDLFSPHPITVHIAEGVFDVLSAYKNFGDKENDVFIGALGSDYISALVSMISKGFVGSNISVRVYMDADQNERYLIHDLKPYKWLFKSISVLKNIKSKDIGVRREEIELEERMV